MAPQRLRSLELRRRSLPYRGGAMLALLAFDGRRWLESQASPRTPALLDQIAQPMRRPKYGDRFVQGLQH